MEIYKATNKINGDSYIGYATKELKQRRSDHKMQADHGSNSYFHNAIRKYGWNNFNWIIIESNISDFDILKDLEIYWIREFGTKAPNGYNMTDGGDGILGLSQSEETKKKISETKKGKHHSEEAKMKMSKAHKGKKATEETRKKMSEIRKDISAETRKKLSESHKGKKATEETKRKISEGLKGNKNTLGKHHSEETRKKMSESHKGKKRSERNKL